jgi:hypothetical protein
LYTVEVTMVGCSSVKSINATYIGVEEVLSTLVMYPNPAIDKLFVEVPSEWANGHLQLFSSSGQLIQSHRMTGNKMELDVAQLANGVYCLKLSAGNGEITKFFTVNKD